MKAVRYVFAYGAKECVVEFTHPDGPAKSTDEWASSHLRAHAKAVFQRQRGHAIQVEVFDSDVPLERRWFKNHESDEGCK